MSTTRRTLLKLLSALPFAGVVGLKRETFEEQAQRIWDAGIAPPSERPILARLEEWYEANTSVMQWTNGRGEVLPYYWRPPQVRLTRAEVLEFDLAWWQKHRIWFREDPPPAPTPECWSQRRLRDYHGIPIVEAERSDLP